MEEIPTVPAVLEEALPAAEGAAEGTSAADQFELRTSVPKSVPALPPSEGKVNTLDLTDPHSG